MDWIPHPLGLRYRTLASLTGAGAACVIFVAYWAARIAHARTFAHINNCPGCYSTDISPSLTAQPFDWIFRMCRCVPYRCQVCSKRYFRGEIVPTAAARKAPVPQPQSTPDSSR